MSELDYPPQEAEHNSTEHKEGVHRCSLQDCMCSRLPMTLLSLPMTNACGAMQRRSPESEYDSCDNFDDSAAHRLSAGE